MDNHDEKIQDIVVGVKGMKINMLSKIKAGHLQLKRMLEDNKEIIEISRSVGEVAKRVRQYDEESAMILIKQAQSLLRTVDLMRVKYDKLSDKVDIEFDDLVGK